MQTRTNATYYDGERHINVNMMSAQGDDNINNTTWDRNIPNSWHIEVFFFEFPLEIWLRKEAEFGQDGYRVR